MKCLALVALVAALFVGYSDAVATASIDFGSEWLKIGLVKPGVPMEIVLNIESQRKTAVSVSISKGERLFGDHAVNQCVKDPLGSYRYLLPLVGQKVGSAAVQEFTRLFPHYNITAHPARGTVVFNSKDGSHSVEELVAMILEYAVNLAVKSAEQPITSVVVTVPPFFTQAQRKALLLAGKIANINIVQLLNTNTAVAINYGVFRRNEFNETPQHILFFDMGAGSTTASVVQYLTVKKKGSKIGTAQLEVLGVGYDGGLGGIHFDKRLEEHLVKLFMAKNAKLKSSPADDGRANAKFLKEAQRVKKILSANVETYAQIENAFAEKDFKALVTRADFEALVEDLYQRITAPIDQALAAADITPDKLDHFIIVGGCTRIPRVQALLSAHLNGRELGKSINADEAAAMGAAYQAAVLSKGFKVKEFLVKDISPFPIDVEFERTEAEAEGEEKKEAKTVTRTLFHVGNPMPQKKLLSFNNKKTDFSFTVKYGNLSFLSENARALIGDALLLDVNVTGVEDIFAAHTAEAAKGIKAHFRLDESGLLHFDGTDALFEPPAPESDGILEKLSSLLGNAEASAATGAEKTEQPTEGEDTTAEKEKPSSKAEGAEKTESTEGAESAENATASNTTDANATATNATNTTALPAKPKLVKVPLTFATAVRDSVAPDTDEIAAALEKLRAFAAKEQEKHDKEAAKNAVEAFVYITKDKLTLPEVIEVSTEEERAKLEADLIEASNWLEEDGFDGTVAVYKERLGALNRTARPIFFRLSEKTDRPEALARMKKSLNMTYEFLAMARNTTLNLTEGEDPWIKPTELDSLSTLANETQEWMSTQTAKQDKLAAHEDPVLRSAAVRAKADKLDRELVFLIRRYNVRPKPKAKKATNATKGNATASNTTETPGTETPGEKTTEEKPAEEKGSEEHQEEEQPHGAEGEAEEQDKTSQTESDGGANAEDEGLDKEEL